MYKLFIAEGYKTVSELLNSGYNTESILISKENKNTTLDKITDQKKVHEVDFNVIKKISSFKTPQPIIGIFSIPEYHFEQENVEKDFVIMLDDIQDPGNLGTIIRIADWFGLYNIICSNESVDVYNPKVVQASMGSIAKVKVFYNNLSHILENTKLNVYGMYLEGENIYSSNFKSQGYVVFGNESKGISPNLEKYITKKIVIPSFTPKNETIDSLNVSVASGIVCSELRRCGYSK